METNLKVRKVIAKDDERIFIESSMEEVENFIVQRIREEFNDKSILCIKFEFSYFENFEESESTSWFINPYYVRNISSIIEDEYEKLFATFDDDLQFSAYHDSYGPKMASEIPPEFLLTNTFWEDINFIENYYHFYRLFELDNLTDKEIINKFFEFLRTQSV